MNLLLKKALPQLLLVGFLFLLSAMSCEEPSEPVATVPILGAEMTFYDFKVDSLIMVHDNYFKASRLVIGVKPEWEKAEPLYLVDLISPISNITITALSKDNSINLPAECFKQLPNIELHFRSLEHVYVIFTSPADTKKFWRDDSFVYAFFPPDDFVPGSYCFKTDIKTEDGNVVSATSDFITLY